MIQTVDAIVVGSGPSALAAAALLARQGLAPALVGAAPSHEIDPRTVALMQPSIRLLSHLEIWPGRLSALAQPLRRLRIIDDTGSLLTSPTVTFSAGELNLEAFGWNLPLEALCQELHALCTQRGVSCIAGPIESFAVADGSVTVGRGVKAEIAAPVIIAADGKKSFVRQSLGVATHSWSYEQAAIAATFEHSLAHDDLSIEYHRAAGPLTTVPLPGRRSGLVWMETPERAGELMALDESEFRCELQAATHGRLGRILAVGNRSLFPMGGLIASEFGGPRTLLVGEAAHVVPPVGAQGLNMSLRDAATAAELIGDARRNGLDPGGGHVLHCYNQLRRRDVLPRQEVIHYMNRSFLGGSMLLSALRVLGFTAIDRISPLREMIMNEGLGPLQQLPLAMRPH